MLKCSPNMQRNMPNTCKKKKRRTKHRKNGEFRRFLSNMLSNVPHKCIRKKQRKNGQCWRFPRICHVICQLHVKTENKEQNKAKTDNAGVFSQICHVICQIHVKTKKKEQDEGKTDNAGVFHKYARSHAK